MGEVLIESGFLILYSVVFLIKHQLFLDQVKIDFFIKFTIYPFVHFFQGLGWRHYGQVTLPSVERKRNFHLVRYLQCMQGPQDLIHITAHIQRIIHDQSNLFRRIDKEYCPYCSSLAFIGL